MRFPCISMWLFASAPASWPKSPTASTCSALTARPSCISARAPRRWPRRPRRPPRAWFGCRRPPIRPFRTASAVCWSRLPCSALPIPPALPTTMRANPGWPTSAGIPAKPPAARWSGRSGSSCPCSSSCGPTSPPPPRGRSARSCSRWWPGSTWLRWQFFCPMSKRHTTTICSSVKRA